LTALNLDKIKATLERAPKEFQGFVAQVGFPSGGQYEDGTPIASVAAQNEFGAPAKKIPPRPFMRPTIKENKDEWVAILSKGVASVVAGKNNAFDVLNAVGILAAADMKAKIATIYSPALAPMTLALRRERGNGSTKPLVDTGVMLAYLQNSVAKEGSEFIAKG